MADADTDIIDTLRGLMTRRKLKMTDLAKDISIPYRSLQNYMLKRSPMPLSVYIQACAWIGVTPDYPVTERFKLDNDALRDALISAFGEELFNSIDFDDHMRWTIGPRREMDTMRVRSRARTFAEFVSAKYDLLKEGRLRTSEDDDEIGQ